MANAKAPKRSVALAICSAADASKILLVRRPDDDDEFPGLWGLPAASCREDETRGRTVRRLGTEKLGTGLKRLRHVRVGTQKRDAYSIEMTLFEALLDQEEPQLQTRSDSGANITLYSDWRWGEPHNLVEAAQQGSLCSQLLLALFGDA
ncbi:hypothetical protein NKDENANG_00370 [Candidatus Entotheonellaceae bacterium PAL068K]